MEAREFLRRLPAVHQVLETPPLDEALRHYPREAVTEAVGEELEALRRTVREHGAETVPQEAPLAEAVARGSLARLKTRFRPGLRRVVNATGVVVHTNLGRSLLAEEALEAVAAAGRAYTNLEFELETGARGSRYAGVQARLRRLTGAEDALVVNNNAAAVLLALAATAAGREVIVSRGELVEIGGSFRIPDVMRQSGARLREVGTTNKTHARDYREALGDETAAILKVHTSNYRVVGFTSAVPLEELAVIAAGAGVPLLEDLGSGLLYDLAARGVGDEPTVAASLAAGADLVTFSGDKLLGGPQAGILAGRRELVKACRRHPLCRAVRPDKLVLAALEATLLLYERGTAAAGVPTLRSILRSREDVEAQARYLASRIRQVLPAAIGVAVEPGYSQVGGGAMPLEELPTVRVAITSPEGAEGLRRRLLRHEPPVVVRVQDEKVLLDPRTLVEGDDEVLVAALAQPAAEAPPVGRDEAAAE